ncbi:hypothetical protein B0H11DRAFT_1948991 [Mycena galericulata]|nr:hypothetical protein B0H11DRAFT_1948991 [Mycena galericulata]
MRSGASCLNGDVAFRLSGSTSTSSSPSCLHLHLRCSKSDGSFSSPPPCRRTHHTADDSCRLVGATASPPLRPRVRVRGIEPGPCTPEQGRRSGPRTRSRGRASRPRACFYVPEPGRLFRPESESDESSRAHALVYGGAVRVGAFMHASVMSTRRHSRLPLPALRHRFCAAWPRGGGTAGEGVGGVHLVSSPFFPGPIIRDRAQYGLRIQIWICIQRSASQRRGELERRRRR